MRRGDGKPIPIDVAEHIGGAEPELYSTTQHRNRGDLIRFHCVAKHRGAFRNGRAGRDDIVDEEEARAFRRRFGKAADRSIDSGEIAESFATVEPGLSRRFPDAQKERAQGQVETGRSAADEFAGEFVRLVETALPFPSRMEGHRHDPPGSAFAETRIAPDFVEEHAEEPSEVAFLAVFEAMDESGPGTRPAEGADGEVDGQFAVAAIPAAEGKADRPIKALAADAAVVLSDPGQARLTWLAEKGHLQLPRRFERAVARRADGRVNPAEHGLTDAGERRSGRSGIHGVSAKGSP